MSQFIVPAYEWYGDKSIKLDFPEGWIVNEQHMKGHNAKALSTKEIAEILKHPVGSPPLSELAKGRRKCVIIFDDMTRPTKIWQMIPPIIEELHRGGISDDRIIFIMATGAHGARLLQDFKKKLGDEIPERYYIFNHNPYENLLELGETSNGTPVKINREVMSCDLKVAVNALMPHFGFGFGGGAKMILPGVAGIDSITHNHKIKKGVGSGMISENLRRLDAEEAAKMAGLDFIVNVLINAERNVTDLVCGDFVEAHREGVKRGRKHYVTQTIIDADISIGNGYPMSNEGYKAYKIAVESVREGGDLVFLLYTPEGCRVHYYNGRFGVDFGGRGWSPDVYVRKPWKMKRVIVVSTDQMKADEWYYGKGSTWLKSWKEAVRILKETHGSDASVALYPCAAMQISELNAKNN